MVVMVLLRRSFKYSLPLRDKLHALRFVANYRRLNRGISFDAWYGVRFATRFLVGRGRDSLFTLALPRTEHH